MMRSLYSGISGLSVHQTKMDIIGNNIANVNTTAFKSSRVTFNEIFSQKLSGASRGSENIGGTNPQQIGLGTSLGSIDVLMTEGAVQRTDRELDLKIEGSGFFVVKDGTGFKFTRDGSFKVDVNGNLVNSAGLFVCGWKASKDGTINKAPVEPLRILTADTYSVAPVKSTAVDMEKNLNIKDGSSPEGISQLTNFYDSLGNKYTMKTIYRYFKSEDDVDAYNDTAIAANKVTVPDDATYPLWLVDRVESITDSSGKEVMSQEDPTKTLASVVSFVDDTDTATPVILHFDNAGNLATGTDELQSINFDFSAAVDDAGYGPINGVNAEVGADDKIFFDFTKLTQYNSQTTATPTVLDGNAPGTFSGFSIGSDGVVSAKYSNGLTKILGQVSLANFTNPAGLEKVGGNLFVTTMNSGDFDGIGVSADSVGSLNPGALEMSNVDLSKEFTEMITAQRGFQANSRIITVSDTLLEELTNLKR